ncbi:hypothetical protein [Streptomyces sp. NPDC101150]|uniref:hypothetical protein n=1 Tax=Streptomyces sp. NPDC101150 TaxID=3366114 RepID=UPI0038194240
MDPATCTGGWPEALDQAHHVLAERLAKVRGDGETLNSLTMMLDMAAKYVEGGDLYKPTVVPLKHSETLSQNL